MIEPGRYRARCTGPADAEWGISSNGNPQLALLFELLDQGNLQMTWIGTFAPGKATEFALQALENCGWQGDDPTEDLTGVDSEEVELVINTELDQEGNSRLRVSWVNRPGSGRIRFKQPAGPGELAAYKADIRAAVAAQRAGTRSAPTARGRPAVQQSRPQDENYGCGSAKDDIPF